MRSVRLRLFVGNGLDRSVIFGCRGVFCENGKPFVGKPTFPLSREYIVRPRTAARAVPTFSVQEGVYFPKVMLSIVTMHSGNMLFTLQYITHRLN